MVKKTTYSKSLNRAVSEVARLRALNAELVAALAEIQGDCETIARDAIISIGERRTWRVIAHKCNTALAKAVPTGRQVQP